MNMRQSRGFTLLELLLVIVIFGTVTAMAMIKMGSVLSRSKVDRAASVVAADLELTFSSAGRLRQPVRLRSDFAGKSYRVNDVLNGGALRLQRKLGADTQYGVDSVRFTPDSVTILPPGRGSAAIRADIWVQGKMKRVTMSTAGFVRIITP